MGGRDNLPARHHLRSESQPFPQRGEDLPTPRGGRRYSRLRGEATGDHDPPPRRRKAVPPALHLRKPGQSLGERQHLTPPPAPFYRPLSTSPTPRQRGHHQGEGNQTVIGRKPPRPREGCVPGSLPNPAFRTAYPARWLRLFLFHRSVRLSAAPDSGLLLGGSASRPSKRSYELS